MSAAELQWHEVHQVAWRDVTSFHGPVRVAVYPDDTVCAGIALRDLRIERGYGLREAAQRLGMDSLTLSRLERGAADFDDRASAWAVAEAAWPERPEEPKR